MPGTEGTSDNLPDRGEASAETSLQHGNYSWLAGTFDTQKFTRSNIEAALALIVTDVIQRLDDLDALSGDLKNDLTFQDNPLLKTRRLFLELDCHPRDIRLILSFHHAISHQDTLDTLKHMLSRDFEQFKLNPGAFIAQFPFPDTKDFLSRKQKICARAQLVWHGLHKLAAEVQSAVPPQFSSIFELLDWISHMAEMYMNNEKDLQSLMDNLSSALVQANTVFLERGYYSLQINESSERLIK
ncbi:hypothetical protein C8F01DRAFT_1081384 [Mycena amicta]|nr:hypothetical protein C8F01DRAFT_1081384 [Mycena amicta]